MRTAFLGAATLAVVLALSGAARAMPPVWTAKSPTCTVTLFGSVHLLPEGLDWEPPALVQALSQADELWFEIPVDAGGQAETVAAAQARSLLPADDALSRHLSAEGLRRLQTQAEALGLSPDKLERFQPWFADLALSSALYLKQGAKLDEGVEQKLAEAAPQARREAFETAAQQIALFAGASLADQAASLEDTLREMADDPDAYRQLVEDWVKGDMGSIYQHDILTLKHDAPGLFKAFLTDRNAAFTRVLAARLKGSCRAVVVVGAAHLIGPDGVPARLRVMGYRVEGPR